MVNFFNERSFSLYDNCQNALCLLTAYIDPFCVHCSEGALVGTESAGDRDNSCFSTLHVSTQLFYVLFLLSRPELQ